MSLPYFLTIGHSTHTLDAFIQLLRDHAVTAIADVRTSPYSRFQPVFNKDVLHLALAEAGIGYVFLGRELGARPSDRRLYLDGRVQYSLLAETDSFRVGLDRVLKGADTYRVALMCAEKDPLECHRTLLVGRALEERGADLAHILGDSSLESSEAAMSRLLRLLKLPEEDLFRKRGEIIDEACRIQAKRIAYVDRDLRAAAEVSP